MQSRPRDICTAAFYDDTERLRQLALAAGLFTGRWQPPCHIDTNPAIIAAINADLRGDVSDEDNNNNSNGNADGEEDAFDGFNHNNSAMRGVDDDDVSGGGSGSSGAGMNIISEEAAEEMAEVVSEEELTALMAHPELLRLTQMYTLDEETIASTTTPESNIKNGNVNDGDDDDENPLFDEAEEEAAEADRQAQQRDLLIYRCLLAEQKHRESVAQRLRTHGFIHTSTTPPVNMTPYGILFSCRETSAHALLSQPHQTKEIEEDADGEAEDVLENAEDGNADKVALQVRWQPSKRSRYAGTPLHWAVLGRNHDTVKFLIKHGADAEAGLQVMEPGKNSSSSSSKKEGMPTSEENSGDHEGSEANKVLQQLTPAVMARANASYATLRVLEAALEARAEAEKNDKAFCVALEKRLQRRQRRYLRRHEMAVARRALQAQASRAEAEAERGDEDGNEEGNRENGEEEDEEGNY